MQYPYNPTDETVPFSGINAPGNSLTSAGPTQEPFGSGDAMMDKKKQMAMMLMGKQLQGMGGQSLPASQPQPRQPLDIYGQPIQGA